MHRTDVAPGGQRLAGWRRPLDWASERCQSLRGRRLPWLATAFGTGVGIYFALPSEPSAPVVSGLLVLTILLAWLGWLSRGGVGPLLTLLAALVCGILAAQGRTTMVAGPVIDFRYHGPVEGRVVKIDRSASGAVRVTLDRVRLDRVGPDRTPRRVRLSLHGEGGLTRPQPGTRVMTTAFLSRPAGPTEPDGFDFQRHAWFLKLGAIGYTRVPLLTAAPSEGGLAVFIAGLREDLGVALRDRMPGQVGAVAVAITTGDRSGLSEEVVESLRASNLAHLLAISGLHMGLLVGFVFWAVRGGLALWPRVALTAPIRVYAALAAFPFALAYLGISGGSVATQRAFVMAAVMLGAIVVGRRAMSMRSVAIAALLILVWRPESLTGPGFQMSFAATGALVVVFRACARQRSPWLRGWRGAVLSLLISSIVAGAATGPFAAAHFNRVGQFGVLANMLAVPVMGFAVMPVLLVALLLWPLGLEAGPLWVAGRGIEWIIGVSDFVAGLPGSVGTVAAPPWTVVPLLGLGYAVAGCLTGRRRLAGGVVVAAAMGLWAAGDRPDILISADGRLVGRMTEAGRHLSRGRGAGFVAESWLENDGDAALQADAAARPASGSAPVIIPVRRARDADDAFAECRGGWVVAPMEIGPPPPGCRLLGPEALEATGAIAVRIGPNGTLWERHAVARQGRRPWVELE
jgi:competence protein ComEC